MRFAFAGTPDFAARVLRHLCESGRHPCLVISQPDRPKGRGRKACAPEVVRAAQGLCLPWIQVDDVNSSETISAISGSGATVLIVAAFGQILRPSVLDRFLCLNVHASLLPKYRGAAPIERAIAAGEGFTGVSIMRMVEGLDEGPWSVQSRLSIGCRDDAGSVARSLAVLGANGIDHVLTGLSDGNVTWIEQTGDSTYASKLGPADAVFDVTLPAAALHDRVRSLSPGIGARMAAAGLSLKVWRSWPFGADAVGSLPPSAGRVSGVPGNIAACGGRLFVGCGEGLLEILLVQPAGKSRMEVADFLRGYGERLGGHLERLPERQQQ